MPFSRHSIDAVKYDRNMATTQAKLKGLKWFDPGKAPFRLMGFPWYATDRVFRRMPLKPPAPLPEAVDNLAWHTSGGQVHFRTDSRHVVVRVKLRFKGGMPHMPRTGTCGCDLYIGPPGDKLYYHTTRFEPDTVAYEILLFEHTERRMREFTLNLPLYNGVDQLAIGVDRGCTVKPPRRYDDDRSVVIYGTSITHGGCASRPGMSYTNILSRRINVPFVNLGFSGSGQAEPEVARAIAAIPDPLLFVIDCEANCCPPGTYEARLPVFIDILRAAHPQAAILVLSRIPNATENFQAPSRRARLARVKFQRELVASRRRAGDNRIHFHDGSELLEPDGHEGTVDTTHPNDTGFYHMAVNLEPIFKRILKGIR
ncbi:MAG: SGNH/GDSL hydrolase family protein [Planctomycetota bacterium]